MKPELIAFTLISPLVVFIIYDACDEYKTFGHLLDEIQELLK